MSNETTNQEHQNNSLEDSSLEDMVNEFSADFNLPAFSVNQQETQTSQEIQSNQESQSSQEEQETSGNKETSSGQQQATTEQSTQEQSSNTSTKNVQDNQSNQSNQTNQLTPEQQQQYLEAQRKKFRENLQTRYATELESLYGDGESDDSAYFDDNQKKFLRDFAAQVHMNAMSEVMQQMQQQAPSLVASQIQQQLAMKAQVEQVEKQFFDQFPGLKDQKFVESIQKASQMIGQLHPKASIEDKLNKMGSFVIAEHGLNPLEVRNKSGAQKATSSSSQSPVNKQQNVQRQQTFSDAPLRATGGTNSNNNQNNQQDTGFEPDLYDSIMNYQQG